MRIKMNVKTGAITVDTIHNQITACVLRIKSCVKAGDWPAPVNHKQIFALGLKALALALLFTVWAGAASAQPYQVVHSETTAVTNNLTRTVTTVQVGGNPLNRFFMHRVMKNLPEPAFQGVILLLPPLGSGFQNYEVSADNNYDNSFVAFFADRGFDVWGYSQRVQGIVAGSCESGGIDCSPMADWGLQTIVNDVAFIRQQIGLAHPGEKPVIGGLSLGSIASVAVINAAPNDYAGALLIEGTLYDTDPQVRAINQGFCAMFDGLLAQGVYYDGQQLPAFKLVAQLATVSPNDPSPLPGFPPGFTNHQAFVAFLSTPNISPITPRPNYFLAAGDAQQDRLFFANDALLRANIAQFVDYVALRTIRDVSCGLAGDRTFTNNLQNFNGAVYVVAGGHGFGSSMLDTAALMTSASKTINFVEEFGHVDAYFEGSHQQDFAKPILAWLKRVVSHP
jgi:pimeloyl-ACP methyl ester carboxylesterase